MTTRTESTPTGPRLRRSVTSLPITTTSASLATMTTPRPTPSGRRPMLASTSPRRGGEGRHEPSGAEPTEEVHRIYWQQWIVVAHPAPSEQEDGHAAHGPPGLMRSHRELVTSSTPLRWSAQGTRAHDVTRRLRETLHLSPLLPTPSMAETTRSSSTTPSRWTRIREDQDALVLVGTLFSLPRDHVQFEHELTTTAGLIVHSTHHHHHHHHPPSHLQPSEPSPDASDGDHPLGNTTPLDATTSSMTLPSSLGPPRADPFHVVRTLLPDEDPQEVREQMMYRLQHLWRQATRPARPGAAHHPPLPDAVPPTANTTTLPRTIMSPKLQWFFVPAAHDAHSPIPNCVELDGYATSWDPEDDDIDENDDTDENDDDTDENDDGDDGKHDTGTGHKDLEDGRDQEIEDPSRFFADDQAVPPSSTDRSRLSSPYSGWADDPSQTSVHHVGTDSGVTTEQRAAYPETGRSLSGSKQQQQQRRLLRLRREIRRGEELIQSQSALPHQCLSGYLLKRSNRDPHVWRRVHCVLTDDSLWYVTRIYDHSATSGHRYAQHGRIRLTQALLLEPTADYAPLFRTPFALEVVSSRGTSHIFRATSKAGQMRWIQTLSDRIVQAYENSLMDNAELLAVDECLARNRRMAAVAVTPLWDTAVRICEQKDHDANNSSSHNNDHNQQGEEGSVNLLDRMNASSIVGAVLRWGIHVAEYRERCRLVTAMLPARCPVVVTTPRGRTFSSPGVEETHQYYAALDHGGSNHHHHSTTAEPLDPWLRDMVQATWALASDLLARAAQVARQDQTKMSRSVETLCRHVDYVLTGTFRSTSLEAASPPPPGHHDQPPPVDLFDLLLAELHVLAAISSSCALSSSASSS